MITVTYLASDGFTKTETFTTRSEAREFAVHWVGEHPEMGGTYAISGDGVGRITAEGISINDLFQKEVTDLKTQGTEHHDAEETRLPPVLAEWYSADFVNEIGGKDRIRQDIEHWERVEGHPERFPNADLEAIGRFLAAAYPYLH
ncbi:hypothetical protein [Ruegeria sp. HKCCD8929]|uniref:hypothetical protein n=1 Tax=Ruegeria sp. HKCCD8929 TaxID=2683006 RepID=UPI0014894A05|nr:hypothetical protein [Ruegeria sp. HKCCD8929]